MRYRILNIWVDGINLDEALENVVQFVEHGDRVHTILASNPEKNFSVPRDPKLYKSFENADLLIPDGIGMVLAARLLHSAQLSRVPGCELMESICALSAHKGYSVYIFGAKEAVNKQAAEVLELKYPGLQVAGRRNGYLDDAESDALVDEINASGAQILFVALGSPRQEQWVARNKSRLKNIRVCQGIGGTLDVITGNVKRSPRFFREAGLEWLYRLLAEPKRMKRQWVLPVFAWKVLLKKGRRS